MNAGRKIGYKRISTVETAQPQLQNLTLDKIFVDMEPLSTQLRKVLKEAIAYLRKGDILVVQSANILASDNASLYSIINAVKSKGATIEFLNNNLKLEADNNGEFYNPYHKMLFNHIASFAYDLARGEREVKLEQKKFKQDRLDKVNAVNAESAGQTEVQMQSKASGKENSDKTEENPQTKPVKQLSSVHFKREKRSNFTQEEIKKICQYSKMGMTAPAVAKIMNCKPVSIYKVWHSNGLSKKKIMEMINKPDSESTTNSQFKSIDVFEEKEEVKMQSVPMHQFEPNYEVNWYLPLKPCKALTFTA